MTGAEWFEAYTNASSNGLTALAILLTLVSGYMVIAYLVGEKLTVFQVTLVNSMYVLSGSTLLLSNYGSVLDSTTARTQAGLLVSELAMIMGIDASPTLLASLVAGINTLFIVISLLFMWQVRHPKS